MALNFFQFNLDFIK